MMLTEQQKEKQEQDGKSGEGGTFFSSVSLSFFVCVEERESERVGLLLHSFNIVYNSTLLSCGLFRCYNK